MAAPCTDHLFLTGDKGVGKSTLARCLLPGHTPCGFRTVRVTGVLDRPSVHLLPAVGGTPSAENLLFYCGAYSCDRFDTLGTAALRDRDGDVLLMDELGPAESGANHDNVVFKLHSFNVFKTVQSYEKNYYSSSFSFSYHCLRDG